MKVCKGFLIEELRAKTDEFKEKTGKGRNTR